jgi:hypothetical protein
VGPVAIAQTDLNAGHLPELDPGRNRPCNLRLRFVTRLEFNNQFHPDRKPADHGAKDLAEGRKNPPAARALQRLLCPHLQVHFVEEIRRAIEIETDQPPLLEIAGNNRARIKGHVARDDLDANRVVFKQNHPVQRLSEVKVTGGRSPERGRHSGRGVDRVLSTEAHAAFLNQFGQRHRLRPQRDNLLGGVVLDLESADFETSGRIEAHEKMEISCKVAPLAACTCWPGACPTGMNSAPRMVCSSS